MTAFTPAKASESGEFRKETGRTTCPAAARWVATARPMNPEAPVRATFIPLTSLESHDFSAFRAAWRPFLRLHEKMGPARFHALDQSRENSVELPAVRRACSRASG